MDFVHTECEDINLQLKCVEFNTVACMKTQVRKLLKALSLSAISAQALDLLANITKPKPPASTRKFYILIYTLPSFVLSCNSICNGSALGNYVNIICGPIRTPH